MADWIEIGKIVAAQGLRGEVRVLSYSDFPERFLVAGTRWLRSPHTPEPQPVELLHGRPIPGKNLYVLQLANVTQRDQADALRGAMVLVQEGDRPPLAAGEFHVGDLVGLEVFHAQTQVAIGVVVDVFAASQDLLEVKLHQPPPLTRSQIKKQKRRKQPRSATVLIPFVMEIVPTVDLEQGRLEILPPAGLLPEGLDNGSTTPDPSPEPTATPEPTPSEASGQHHRRG